MYRIIEVANNLGVSKVTIYKKISALKPEIKKHLIKEKNVTFLTQEGVRLIQESLRHYPSASMKDERDDVNTNRLAEVQGMYYKETEKVLEAYLGDLVMQYDYLKAVVKYKQDRYAQLQQTTEVLRRLCKNIRSEGNGGE